MRFNSRRAVIAAEPDGVEPAVGENRDLVIAQLDTMTHNTSEFLRREHELLLDGRGLPPLRTPIAGRPVVVVCEPDHTELAGVRQFVREQDPVILAVGAAANDLLGWNWVPQVVLVTADQPQTVPAADALRIATDVVVVGRRGAGTAEHEAMERLGIRPLRVESAATAEDVALLLAERQDATLIVGVGLHTRLEDFLDRQHAGRASTFATRLKVGSRLIDARAVRALYSSRTRPAHVLAVLLAGLVALGAAIAVTPVGQQWASELGELVDHLQGLL